MAAVTKISPDEARAKLGSGALLVCAYDDEAKCAGVRLDGSITLAQLEAQRPSKDREIIFYCN